MAAVRWLGGGRSKERSDPPKRLIVWLPDVTRQRPPTAGGTGPLWKVVEASDTGDARKRLLGQLIWPGRRVILRRLCFKGRTA